MKFCYVDNGDRLTREVRWEQLDEDSTVVTCELETPLATLLYGKS